MRREQSSNYSKIVSPRGTVNFWLVPSPILEQWRSTAPLRFVGVWVMVVGCYWQSETAAWLSEAERQLLDSPSFCHRAESLSSLSQCFSRSGRSQHCSSTHTNVSRQTQQCTVWSRNVVWMFLQCTHTHMHRWMECIEKALNAFDVQEHTAISCLAHFC